MIKYQNRYYVQHIDINIRISTMKVSLIVIAAIIALQSTTLLFNSSQRYIFHHSLHQYSVMGRDLLSIKTAPFCQNCFVYDEEFRVGLVAFMYGAALLLFAGQAVWPAFLAQIFWIALESYICTDQGVANLRNFAVQLLILFVLASNLSCCGCNSTSKPVQKSTSQTSQQSQPTQAATTMKQKASIITSRTDSIASNTNTEKSENKGKQKQNKKHR